MTGDECGRPQRVLDAHERNRRWAATCAAIDEVVADVVRQCFDIDLPMTKLRGFKTPQAWTFDIMAPTSEHPWDVQAHMHLGFFADGDWALLGHHRGDYRLIVDKTGPLHPGLRQEFIYDRRRRQADVILTLSRDQIWDAITGQMYILAALGSSLTGGVHPRSRYC